MKMTDKDQITDAALEALFDQARSAPPEVPEGLMQRVIADAAAQQSPASVWSRLIDTLGGLPGLGGLATATFVGIWLGVAPPAQLPDLAGQILGIETYTADDLDAGDLTGFGWDIEEG